MRAARLLTVMLVASAVAAASAQTPRQLTILEAEARRAHTARDLSVLRIGARSTDVDTAVLAVRALGRLERPALISDLLPRLGSRMPEVRAEAATAIGQAAQGWSGSAPAVSLNSAITALISRLEADDDPDVRASVSQTLGRLPYTTGGQVGRAEQALVQAAADEGATITDRLGVAQGLEALVRLHAGRKPPDAETLALLGELAAPPPGVDTAPRVRRLALTALITLETVDDGLVSRASVDADEQVRRLAMRAAASAGVSAGGAAGVLAKGLQDPEPMVRIEALATANARQHGDPTVCAGDVTAAADPNLPVALFAIDQLDACGASPDAAALLEGTVAAFGSPASRSWHAPAHALVALAAAAPERARDAIAPFAASADAHARLYAARAAGRLQDRSTIERLARDGDDNVREAALEQLRTVEGHAADALYIESLARPGYQAVRAAAFGLTGSPSPDAAVPALKTALTRLEKDGGDNATSAREAIRAALVSLDMDLPPPTPPAAPPSDLMLDAWRSAISTRARVTMADGGAFELALLADLAPQTVMRFIDLARSGYYDGLTFHRVVPNFVVQGGSPGANEYIGGHVFMNDEVGSWPHTRGAVGLSTRGRDTGDAQFFIDLVDNPRLDHAYTVFAHVLEGMDVVDAIVEGDTIAHVEIVETP